MCAFHYPAPFDNFESWFIRVLPSDLQHIVAMLFDPCRQAAFAVGVISQGLPHSRKLTLLQLSQQLRSSITIHDPSAGDHHGYDQTHSVREQMPFSSVDFLVRVNSTRSTDLRSLHR